jgi:cyclase
MKRSSIALILAVVALAGGLVFGQGQAYSPLGIDLTGYWIQLGRQQDAGLGTAAGDLVDFGGVPLSEAGRLGALAWSASRLLLPQHQCIGYIPPYVFYAPGYFRIGEMRDPYTQELTAVHMRPYAAMPDRYFWMDDRAEPPPYALHTWAGFSKAKYEDNMLSVYTTHIKEGHIRANGMEQSSDAEVSEHFIRHGDRITYFSVIYDPVNLDEPFPRTISIFNVPNDPNSWTMPCDDGELTGDLPKDHVAHYDWGAHPFLRETADKVQIPLVGELGGPATIYPEFAARAKDPNFVAATEKALVAPAPGQPVARKVPDVNPRDGQIHVLPVRDGVYMLVGDGANIAVQVGTEGAIVVDTGTGELADKVIAEVKKLSKMPIQFIYNTSFHADHVGGNVRLRSAGRDPEANGGNLRSTAGAGSTATILSHVNTVTRLEALPDFPAIAWPTDTFSENRRRKLHNGEGVEAFWEPNAATDGDAIIHFRRSDVIVTGDIFNTTQYPFIDVKNGGSIQGEIKALTDLLDRTVSFRQEGGTLIIPGHGRLCNEWEVTLYRDMVVLIRDRVQAMINKGATLQQVQAARVSADYDPEFGSNSGPWTTAMFIEAVYNSLKNPPAKTAAN